MHSKLTRERIRRSVIRRADEKLRDVSREIGRIIAEGARTLPEIADALNAQGVARRRRGDWDSFNVDEVIRAYRKKMGVDLLPVQARRTQEYLADKEVKVKRKGKLS